VLLELVRALDRRALSVDERVQLLRLLVLRLVGPRGPHPMPELLELLTANTAGMKLTLRYDIRRVSCPKCQAVKVERVPWAETCSWFTVPFEDHVAYLAQTSDQTAVSSSMRIGCQTVGAIVQRVVARRRQGDPLDGLVTIGVDELSYRRHHQYVTVVVDHATRRIVWAREGKDADTLKAFFAELGEARGAKLEAVTIDMSAAYIKAVTEASPQAQIIFDRFHVQRLAQDAVDDVRRDEVRAATSEEERQRLKGTRWPLLKSFWKPLAVRLVAPLPAATGEQAALPGLPAQGRPGPDPRLYE
jgi:transposase